MATVTLRRSDASCDGRQLMTRATMLPDMQKTLFIVQCNATIVTVMDLLVPM